MLGQTAPVLLVLVALAAPCCVSALPHAPAYDVMLESGGHRASRWLPGCSTCARAIGASGTKRARVHAHGILANTSLF